ncbi:hypothetical protein ALQ89_01222 [Pseudomonas amygdali pv. tabaci]|uniref:CopG family transcriptional regulator n=2 Tax=Pseudomonas amygdali TaxID=47877 RepID=A0AAX1VSJ0_PSEAJ|nr:hypothetical protein ALQ89_01222 [Pseudomonas amygdali pv. tabaci]
MIIMQNKIIKIAMPLDLIELLEAEAEHYDSFTRMVNAVCRRYFLHRELKEQFAKLSK